MSLPKTFEYKGEQVTFMDLYYKWLTQGEIDSNGLFTNGMCELLNHTEEFKLITPVVIELEDSAYWASGYPEREFNKSISSERYRSEFTPLRQTIVLFCAALNNEL